MGKFFIVLAILALGGTSDSLLPQDALAINDTPITSKEFVKSTTLVTIGHPHPYEIIHWLEPLENETYNMLVDVKLFDSNRYMSPSNTVDTEGVFSIQFEDSQQLVILSELLEGPTNITDYDKNDGVIWIRDYRRFSLKVKLDIPNKGGVKGEIKFLLEPQGTLESIPIIVRNDDGVLWVSLDGC